MSRWDGIPEAMRNCIGAMSPSEVCEFLNAVLNKIEDAEAIVSQRKLLRDYIQFRAAEIFEQYDIQSLRNSDGHLFYRTIDTRFSSKKEERDAFCTAPPKKWAEASSFVKSTVNANTFHAWVNALAKEGKAIPSFVTRTDLALVQRRKS